MKIKTRLSYLLFICLLVISKLNAQNLINENLIDTSSKFDIANLDCKTIYSINCAKLWLRANVSDAIRYYGKTNLSDDKKIFRSPQGVTFEHLYDGSIVSVSFKDYTKIRPTENLKWHAGKNKIIKIFGAPIEERAYKITTPRIVLKYNDLIFELENDELIEISVTRPISIDEVAKDKKLALEIEWKPKSQSTPTRSLAESMADEYTSMHDGIERNVLLNNKYIKEYEEAVRLHLSGKAYDLEKAISNLKKESVEKINNFLKKYDWTITPAMKNHLIEDRALFLK